MSFFLFECLTICYSSNTTTSDTLAVLNRGPVRMGLNMIEVNGTVKTLISCSNVHTGVGLHTTRKESPNVQTAPECPTHISSRSTHFHSEKHSLTFEERSLTFEEHLLAFRGAVTHSLT